MKHVVTAAEMGEIDRITIEEIGLPGAVLMENAGRAVADAVCELIRPGGRVAVLCGAGNNGGDGYVIARILRERGVDAAAYLLSDSDAVTGDAAIHLGAYRQVGGVEIAITTSAAVAEQGESLERADVIVDAMFGTGLTRDVSGHFADAIDAAQRSPAQVVSVDLPSGVCADTGRVLGRAIAADRTVTMAFLKPALAIGPGFARAGDVEVAAIGIPSSLAAAQGIALGMVEMSDVCAHWPALSPLDHKNRRGHVLAVAGAPGTWGAGRLCALAALRSGAGLSTLAGPSADAGAADPIMTAQVPPDDAGLHRLLVGKTAVAIGPGMSADGAGHTVVMAALAHATAPIVLDAAGLRHVGTELGVVANAQAPIVLTPHPGEAAALLGTTTAAVESDRVAAVRKLADASRAVVVLKGARTLVCDGTAGDGFVTINPTGNAGLATAGTGDVLTGVIAGLLAQRVGAGEAARLGVYLHGLAGDLAAERHGQHSLIASDVIDALPAAIEQIRLARAALER